MAISKIWVIGDSHARIFSHNENFIPIFIGEGREHCFIKDEFAQNIKNKTIKILEEAPECECIIFMLGEPDTRFYLGKGWKPWKKNRNRGFFHWKNKLNVLLTGSFKIKKSFKRYCQFIQDLKNYTEAKILIMNITPSTRRDQNRMVNHFNLLLSSFCRRNNIAKFIKVNHFIYDQNTNIIKDQYYGDPVHLNINLQMLVENWLIENGFLEESLYNSEKNIDKKLLKQQFKYNKRFGCYTLSAL